MSDNSYCTPSGLNRVCCLPEDLNLRVLYRFSVVFLKRYNFSDFLLAFLHISSFLHRGLGPVVQSIVSLTSSLVVKMLTVLVSSISNSQVYVLKKMWVAFAKATHIFFSKNISIYAIFKNQSFNNTFTNYIVSFEQLGPVLKRKKNAPKGSKFFPFRADIFSKAENTLLTELVALP